MRLEENDFRLEKMSYDCENTTEIGLW